MSTTFFMRMLVTFLDRTLPASKSAKPNWNLNSTVLYESWSVHLFLMAETKPAWREWWRPSAPGKSRLGSSSVSQCLRLVNDGDFIHFLHFWLFVRCLVHRPVRQPGHLSTKSQKCKTHRRWPFVVTTLSCNYFLKNEACGKIKIFFCTELHHNLLSLQINRHKIYACW